jgi:phosphate acyltransferase
MMKIGLDILGGDFAPEATVKGAILAYKELPTSTKLVLIGDKEKIHKISKHEGFDSSVFEIVHTTENIEMDEQPAKAFAAKPNATIPLGFAMLKAGQIDGFASAGSTGAMMVGAMMVIKTIPGVIRACIASPLPNGTDIPTTVLDVGVNPDARFDVLCQYAVLGSLYAHYVSGIKNPRVALMSIGAEEEKGNLVTKAAFQSLRESKTINFIGNIEGHDLFTDEKADVVVCDGFVGNVILKEAEAFYNLLKKRNIHDPFLEQFNFENYGGTPVLGINSTAIIGHGVSNDKAIKNMIHETCHVVESGLIDKIKDAFK